MFPDEMEKDELANTGDESVDGEPEKSRKNMYSYSFELFFRTITFELLFRIRPFFLKHDSKKNTCRVTHTFETDW